MERKYIVYKYTSPSGKVYIGQTYKSLQERAGLNGVFYKSKKNGKYCQPAFARAIEKYGWESFKSEIIARDLTLDEANQLESDFIQTYKNGGICYNIAEGGRKNIIKSRKVLQYSIDGELIKVFESISDAESMIGSTSAHSNVIECCNGRRKRAYGFIWRYEDSQLKVLPIEKYRVPIQQFTKSRQYVRTFNTAKEASIAVGVTPGAITNCLKGKSKSSGGYIWKYS